MTLPEIRARYHEITDQRTRFAELRDYTHAAMLRCGVTRVMDLPEDTREIIAGLGEGLPTPDPMAEEFAALGRELASPQVVTELRRLYDLPSGGKP